MKSLVESLFDRDIVEKDIKIGDQYKPIGIWIENGVSSSRPVKDEIKGISNMFMKPKLKSIAPYIMSNNDIADLMSPTQKQLASLADFLQYIIPVILKLPLKKEFTEDNSYVSTYVYSEELNNLFEKTVIRHSYDRSLNMEINKRLDKIFLTIRRKHESGIGSITVTFEKI